MMPINLEEHELLLRCACHSSSHVAYLIHDDDWYLSMTLDNFGFWKRVGLAFKYMFAPTSIRYGMTAELVLRNEDVEQIASFITSRRQSRLSDHQSSASEPQDGVAP